jgi:hypothetical protein
MFITAFTSVGLNEKNVIYKLPPQYVSIFHSNIIAYVRTIVLHAAPPPLLFV